jgi:hypothetical protein
VDLRMLLGAFATLVIVAGCGGDVGIRDASGRVVAAGPWNVFDLRAGDCIGDTSQVSGDLAEAPLVPCDEPHTMIVVDVIDHPGAEFPGFGEIAAFADRSCFAALEAELGATVAAEAAFSFFIPTEPGWASGDRSVVCVLVLDEG